MAEHENDRDAEEETFEQSIARLEAIAARLENPETPLDESISLYEEGVRLARRCAERLETAELRMTVLQADRSGPSDEAS